MGSCDFPPGEGNSQSSFIPKIHSIFRSFRELGILNFWPNLQHSQQSTCMRIHTKKGIVYMLNGHRASQVLQGLSLLRQTLCLYSVPPSGASGHSELQPASSWYVSHCPLHLKSGGFTNSSYQCSPGIYLQSTHLVLCCHLCAELQTRVTSLL